VYTIKRAAELVGVTDSTLRAWERRYGFDLSRRTAAGYRLYDDEAVGSLRSVHALVLEGWSVRAAVEEVSRRLAAAAPSAPALAADRGGAPSDPQQVDAVDALVQVAADYDVEGLAKLLDEQFSTASFERVVDGWLLPALRALGAAWADGRVTVAGEHLVSHGVVRRLASAYDAAGANRGAPKVVIGLPRGSRHDLGLLAFATAARRAGLATTYLGADVPVHDWAAAAGSRLVKGVVLAVPTPDDTEAVAQTVAMIGSRLPTLLVAVGGSAQDLAPAQCLRLGHEVGPGADLLAREVMRAR
jgi:methanogenic corrinoid protein MtbC1